MTIILDKGPFYHGTKAALQAGDLLKAGFVSNYDQATIMNHIYFTALKEGAAFAAQVASGQEKAHVYLVEPTGDFENDPNVTDKKFPGNPTRSYRSSLPLKVLEEVTDWLGRPEVEVDILRNKIAQRYLLTESKADSKIIN